MCGKYNTGSDGLGEWKDCTTDTAISARLVTTGSYSDSNKMNIYDFAGNLSEWTLELATTYAQYPSAFRGGHFPTAGDTNPVPVRIVSATSTTGSEVGFRCTLY